MAKYYAPCEDTWPKEWPREVVDSADYERLVEQYASYREAASASIGADLSQQAIERISALEQERDDYILKQKVWEEANDELRSADIALRRALRRSREHISATPHGDNCYVADEFPGNRCVCGKETILDFIDSQASDCEKHESDSSKRDLP